MFRIYDQIFMVKVFAFGNSFSFFFAAANLIKIASSDKYRYCDYGLFDAHGGFSLSDGSKFGKNVIIFSAEMSSLVHSDKKKKHILFFQEFFQYSKTNQNTNFEYLLQKRSLSSEIYI